MTETVTIGAKGEHRATIIFLHGLGDTGHGWASSLDALNLQNIKIVCPTATSKPVSLNMGMLMPSWFDLFSLDPAGKEDENGIVKACKEIDTVINQEIKAGVPSNRIFLGGFSQGGALALYTALNIDKKLAGVIALSAWVPLRQQLDSMSTSNVDTAFFHGHGDEDNVVPYKWGSLTANILKEKLKNYQFETYSRLGHSSNHQEMKDLKVFVTNNG